MIRLLLSLLICVLAGPALAEPAVDPPDQFDRGLIWQRLGRYEKAIEAFEQSFLERQDALSLYYMAESYDRLAKLPARSTPEILESKQRALDLYQQFTIHGHAEEFPEVLAMARTRIEFLRPEIEQLTPQAITEQRLSTQKLDAILLGQKVIIDRLDAIQELLTKIFRRDELRKTGSNR